MLPLGSGKAETGDARSRDGGVREELAAGVVQLKPTTEVEQPASCPLNVKTARLWRGIVPSTHLAREGAYDGHHRTAGVAGRTRRRDGVAARGKLAATGEAADYRVLGNGRGFGLGPMDWR